MKCSRAALTADEGARFSAASAHKLVVVVARVHLDWGRLSRDPGRLVGRMRRMSLQTAFFGRRDHACDSLLRCPRWRPFESSCLSARMSAVPCAGSICSGSRSRHHARPRGTSQRSHDGWHAARGAMEFAFTVSGMPQARHPAARGSVAVAAQQLARVCAADTRVRRCCRMAASASGTRSRSVRVMRV